MGPDQRVEGKYLSGETYRARPSLYPELVDRFRSENFVHDLVEGVLQ